MLFAPKTFQPDNGISFTDNVSHHCQVVRLSTEGTTNPHIEGGRRFDHFGVVILCLQLYEDALLFFFEARIPRGRSHSCAPDPLHLARDVHTHTGLFRRLRIMHHWLYPDALRRADAILDTFPYGGCLTVLEVSTCQSSQSGLHFFKRELGGSCLSIHCTAVHRD